MSTMTRSASVARATRWVSVAEYAAIKNLSVRTVYTYLKDGLIPGAEQVGPGRMHRIPITD